MGPEGEVFFVGVLAGAFGLALAVSIGWCLKAWVDAELRAKIFKETAIVREDAGEAKLTGRRNEWRIDDLAVRVALLEESSGEEEK